MNLIKKSVLLATLFGALAGHTTTNAQNGLSTQVNKQLSLLQPKEYTLFTPGTQRHEAIDKSIRNATYLTLDRKQLKQLLQENNGLISLTLPIEGRSAVTLQLFRYDFHSKDYRTMVHTDGGYTRTENPGGAFYRGALKGQEFSMAAFSFFEDEIGGVFSDKTNGNYNLVLNREHPGTDNDQYILYREDDIIDKSQRKSCAMTDEAALLMGGSKPLSSPAGMGVHETYCKTVRISVFADYFLYQRCSSSLVKSVQYINTVFNVVSALYANDGLFLNLSEAVVSTVSEGYDYSSSTTVLTRFGNLMQTYTYNGDLAHSMTGYRNASGFAPLGGLAWLDVMCTKASPTSLGGKSTYFGPYSMGNTQVMTTIPSLPTYSWDVEVTAHELGHNVGSPHTQSCSWPTGPIDNCVAPEGGCTTVGPAPTSGGTIMSYCHLKAGVGINFANGFGPQPTALLLDKIVSASCLRSGVADSTLQEAGQSVIANAECFDGMWTHYFFDNNTSDQSDDIFVLSVENAGLDIGNITHPDFVLKMTTNTLYGKDTVAKLSVAYADTNWYEINRKWTVQLPAGKQPKTGVRVRYPFLDQDIRDIRKVLLPRTIADTSLVFLKYANTTPVTTPSATKATDVRRLSNSLAITSATKWRSGSEGTYQYAEVMADSGIYGGTLGYQIKVNPPASVGWQQVDQQLAIRPNPSSGKLFIDLPAQTNGMQQVLVSDNLGRTVLSQESAAGNGTISLDVSALIPGVYMLQCIDARIGTSLKGLFIRQ